MKLEEFNYHLPQELIAQKPAKPRDSSRLMVLDTKNQKIQDKVFKDITQYLNKGDVLVLNNTKVFPARLIGNRFDTGGKVEIFLLKDDGGGEWEVLIGSRKKLVGDIIIFNKGLETQIIKKIDDSVWKVKFNKSGQALHKAIDKIGQVPTPPYIKIPEAESRSKKLKTNYQTVYAKNRGSVAAPTAGFHFTKQLIKKLKKQGVQFEYITLHVGLGTFAPVKEDNIEDHKIHSEFAILESAVADRLNQAKQSGRRIISVGTTSTRVLEAFAKNGRLEPGQSWVDIFIYPSYKFKFIDALITNFHLPKSTLLMLVSALAGREFILKAYRQAVDKKYRFYSFGDAMLIDKVNK